VGIFNEEGDFAITGSVIAGNKADGMGGGVLRNEWGTMTVTDIA